MSCDMEDGGLCKTRLLRISKPVKGRMGWRNLGGGRKGRSSELQWKDWGNVGLSGEEVLVAILDCERYKLENGFVGRNWRRVT
jgi:hypothetical protein